ncbi:hypothetical protein Ddc_09731 [Ditylenchus destructor]|nr:hypothetical protein Ddc_09731 [Ditylenchus destructor]
MCKGEGASFGITAKCAAEFQPGRQNADYSYHNRHRIYKRIWKRGRRMGLKKKCEFALTALSFPVSLGLPPSDSPPFRKTG